jgi:hypothetical protein
MVMRKKYKLRIGELPKLFAAVDISLSSSGGNGARTMASPLSYS